MSYQLTNWSYFLLLKKIWTFLEYPQVFPVKRFRLNVDVEDRWEQNRFWRESTWSLLWLTSWSYVKWNGCGVRLFRSCFIAYVCPELMTSVSPSVNWELFCLLWSLWGFNHINILWHSVGDQEMFISFFLETKHTRQY